ncbi:MAG: hypothetical protein EZS28_043341 [Streblomastix strix]|uniref:Uncharacterized protein n=1 Tax=Streblomastix strix TaxID=222440 RepID=A0A5J4TT80_9EUKA|nr:MAG: hypothetical protein EZS28_043341 [Streblomastix strix]
MFYDFQASVLYAYKKLNIAPSYWHMYECQPKTEQSGDALFNSDGTVKEWSKITFQSGVCDESCYGKQASINGKCRTTCKKSTYGNDKLIKEGNSLDANQLKQRLVNFGPVLTSSLTEGTRVYYGWNADGFMYMTRDAEGVLKQEQEETLGSFTKYILAYQFIDCQKDLKATTAKEDCPCPETQDKEYKTDPRTKEGGICAVKPPTPVPGPVVVGASGSIRAFWAVIAAVLLLPLQTAF